MVLVEKLEELFNPILKDMGVGLVSVNMLPGEVGTECQILIENLDASPVSVDLCSKVSRTLSAFLDVNDVFPHKYNLVVSSAGIDRPLVKVDDYKKFKGEDVIIQTRQVVNGLKKHFGKLDGIDEKTNEVILVDDKKQVLKIKYDLISKANLDRVSKIFNKQKAK